MTRESWLEAHPYLTALAEVRRRIDEAVEDAAPLLPVPGDWDEYADDFATGVPLLQSEVRIDLEQAGLAVIPALASLVFDSPNALTQDAAAQTMQLQHDRIGPDRIVDWLLGDDSWQPVKSGLLRTVGWITLSASMRPLLKSFAEWRNEDRWMRRYCPACGSLPAMAQLAGDDPGRMRLLSCGRCATQWRYGRTMCPFCESDAQKLMCIAIEGEGGLRVDYCEACKGYLKTYSGQGHESVLLADWTSLHLDQLALDRGLERKAVSLYEFDVATPVALH